MSERPTVSKDPDIIASAKALRRAARRALEIGLLTGTPVYAIKGGKIMDLTRNLPADSRRIVPVAVRETTAPYRTGKSRRKKAG